MLSASRREKCRVLWLQLERRTVFSQQHDPHDEKEKRLHEDADPLAHQSRSSRIWKSHENRGQFFFIGHIYKTLVRKKKRSHLKYKWIYEQFLPQFLQNLRFYCSGADLLYCKGRRLPGGPQHLGVPELKTLKCL